MGFNHIDQDGDGVKIHKANAANPQHHYVDTTSHLGAYIPFERTSELVASLYKDAGVGVDPTAPRTDSAERSEILALTYARRAAEQRKDEATRDAARDQLVRDFFSRAKGVGIDTIHPGHRKEYEDTCRFFDTDPYDAPGAR